MRVCAALRPEYRFIPDEDAIMTMAARFGGQILCASCDGGFRVRRCLPQLLAVMMAGICGG